MSVFSYGVRKTLVSKEDLKHVLANIKILRKGRWLFQRKLGCMTKVWCLFFDHLHTFEIRSVSWWRTQMRPLQYSWLFETHLRNPSPEILVSISSRILKHLFDLSYCSLLGALFSSSSSYLSIFNTYLIYLNFTIYHLFCFSIFRYFTILNFNLSQRNSVLFYFLKYHL